MLEEYPNQPQNCLDRSHPISNKKENTKGRKDQKKHVKKKKSHHSNVIVLIVQQLGCSAFEPFRDICKSFGAKEFSS